MDAKFYVWLFFQPLSNRYFIFITMFPLTVLSKSMSAVGTCLFVMILLLCCFDWAPEFRVRVLIWWLRFEWLLYYFVREAYSAIFSAFSSQSEHFIGWAPVHYLSGAKKYVCITVLFIEHNTCLAKQARLIKNLPVPLGTLAGKECVWKLARFYQLHSKLIWPCLGDASRRFTCRTATAVRHSTGSPRPSLSACLPSDMLHQG